MHTCRLFYGYWPDTNGRGLTTLTVEQVSHHPPITAYYIANSSRGVTLQGHNAQKTSFSGERAALPTAITSSKYSCVPCVSGGNIIVRQVGHATLTVSLPDSILRGVNRAYLADRLRATTMP